MKLLILFVGAISGLSLQTLSRNRFRQNPRRHSKTYQFVKNGRKLKADDHAIRKIQRLEVSNKECWLTENVDGRKYLECNTNFYIPDGFERIANTFGLKHVPHNHIGVNGNRG